MDAMEKDDAPPAETKSRGSSFVEAYNKQNVFIETAIKSLDNLNEQIVQFIFTPKSQGSFDFEYDLSAKDRETLKTSMVLMRRLLVEAQTKFRKMVDDNRRLASRIDGSIHAANEEVNALRVELAETNRRLCQLSEASNLASTKHHNHGNHYLAVKQKSNQETEEELQRLREENGKLSQEVGSLEKELKEFKESNKPPSPCSPPPNAMDTGGSTSSSNSSNSNSDKGRNGDLKLELIQCHQELNRAREALQAMKSDRKRLKSEKLDLLGQMKQLYCTLEDKESELRDFIRSYELRMRETDHSIKQLAADKEESEAEKWELLTQARDATERCVSLKADLDQRDQIIYGLQSEITELTDQLKDCSSSLQPLKDSSMSVDSVLKASSLDSRTPSGDELPPYPDETASSISNTAVSDTPMSLLSHKSDNSHSSYSAQNLTAGSLDLLPPRADSSRSSHDLHTDGIYVTLTAQPTGIKYVDLKALRKRDKKKNQGALAKLFGSSKARTRRSIAVSDPSIMEAHGGLTTPRVSILNQDNYQEKMSTICKAKELALSQWKASHVLAWLEIEMNMPLYGKACSENIKSGKVLLGLSDSELDSALNLSSVLHRRKLRLAIEELREPSSVQYPKAGQIDHTWTAHKWVHELGLPQYSENFERHLVDGRLLNVLTKKDLEKHLAVHRKFHQVSLLHAVELLRRVNYDKEELSERRHQCDDSDCDPLVWTNHRLIKWVQSIDLHEYADNLRESGVHGSVLVLEPTFNAEAFAAALGIPPSKSYVRRHLATELDAIIRPARAALDSSAGKRAKSSPGGSLGRSFVRSYKGGPAQAQPEETDGGSRGSAKRLSFRGSLGRALGRKLKRNPENSANGVGQNGHEPTQLEDTKRSHSVEIQQGTVV